MKRMEDIFRKILDTISKYNMIQKKDRVIVALSGGPDSVFLLYALHRLRESLEIDLFATHIHHGIRGKYADRDSEFVEKTCDSLSLPVRIFEHDAPGYAKRKGLSTEEAGREIRLSAYKKAMKEFEASKVATGHTADDQAETVLLRLITGAGKRGLAGIHPEYEGFIVRPLLDTRKEEILRYLQEYKIKYMVDHTNFETDMLRNRVRNILIPLLKTEFNPNLESALCRTAAIFQEEMVYLKQITDSHLDKFAVIKKNEARLNLSGVSSTAPYIMKHLLRELVCRFTGSMKDLTYFHTQNLFNLLLKPSGSSIQLPGNIRAEKEYEFLVISKKMKSDEVELPDLILRIPGSNISKEWNVVIGGEILEERPSLDSVNPFTIFIDFDKCDGKEFQLRTRKPGDRFSPIGMKGIKKVKDYFIDKKIPRAQRNSIPIILCGREILWIAGHRQSRLFRMTPHTKRVLKLWVEKNGGDKHA
ncbi:MAG: tRNA lysidine(34) synthetase TilS [Candidatus Eremiobacteraeota bacterium]|nr:tRNA lysidine(34) synthetase TilS [Candidatus Eremiobacteraeota bacterium]